MNREFDIVLMGATSFVGKITARRFAELLSRQPEAFRLALAGRSESKLASIIDDLKREFPNIAIPVLKGDSMSEQDMALIAKQTRVVVSTVGPYDLYGDALVKACAESGTHYCDLTGEPQFIHRMLANFEQTAKNSGACIVHCCGFDSIPSDIGAYFLQKRALEAGKGQCVDVDMRVKAMKGGFSGGTIASLMNIVSDVRKTPSLKKVLFDPYALCPQNKGIKQTYIGKAQPDWVTDQWVAPFVMAPINSKIVMRSAQLLPDLFPDGFRYNEGMLGGKGSKGRRTAKLISAGIKTIVVGAAMAPTRWLLQTFVLPKPGEGPSPAEQEAGFFVVQVHGKTETGHRLSVQVKGDQDPGYGSTSKMLSQAALALAFDLNADQVGGFWTPASLLGDKLIERLAANAGVECRVLN